MKNIGDILLGIAIGDAFGAGVEFQDRNWIRENVDFTQFVNVRHQIGVPLSQLKPFVENYRDWQYTDDTEMTIGVIKALSSNEVFTKELLVLYWKKEYDLGIKKFGYGRSGHGSMAWYYSGKKTIDEIREFQRNRSNPGNAPAMRAVPLGWVEESLINKYARINAEATHPNINAIISSQLIARASEFLLVKNGEFKDVISYCINNVELNEEYKTYLNAICLLRKFEQLTQQDFVILCGSQPIEKPYFLEGICGVPSDSKYTAGCVLYVLKHSIDTFDALKKSILLGGDVDSVASITTGILAGRTGLGSLPQFMINQVEDRKYLLSISKQFGDTFKS